MQIYDPTVTGPELNFVRASALPDLEGKTIGLLSNGKLNAVNLLNETAALFEIRHGCRTAPLYAKANASAPAPADTIAEAADQVDFLLTGLGD